MKNLIAILLLFINLATHAQETYSITGTVTDNKGALPGATVFIANTQKATSADSKGEFNLNGLQPGTYELAVKMLGYELFTKLITIQKSGVDLKVLLKENSIMLKTVSISGITKETREQLLKSIISNLLGYSANAEKCKLLNPDAVNINFKVDRNQGVIPQGITEASSDEFLIIENKALGYNLHYLLTNYKDAYGRLSYAGSLYFEEMKGSKSEQERWKKNRRATYEGSITHFFRAAFSNTLDQEHFLMYKVPYTKHYANQIVPEVMRPYKIPPAMFTNTNENTRLLDLHSLKKDTTQIYVVYTAKNEPGDFVDSRAMVRVPFPIPVKMQQVSIIRPVTDSILINKNGSIDPSYGVLRLGYWTVARAADFLPSDYKVGD